MQFETISKTDGKLVLRIKKASVSFVNAMRRAVIGWLPSFAIDEVDFYENNSPYYNEYLANRLGLIPLTFGDEVAEDSRVSLKLDGQGPGIIYSKDLISETEAVRPANGDFPIADLAEGQRLRLEAWAVLGTPQKHAKFQNATASYSYYPEYSLKKTLAAKEFLGKLPKKVFNEEGEVSPWHAELVEEFLEQHPDDGEFKYKEDEFIFTVESYNNETALQKLEKAIAAIKADAATVRKEFK